MHRAKSPAAHRLVAAVAVVLALVVAATAAQAQPIVPATQRGHWRTGFRRVGVPDYVWGGVTVTGLLLEVALLQPNPPPVRFDGPILFDTAVRDALRYQTTAVHNEASTIGWIGLLGLLAYPVAVDIPVAWARGGSALAWQFFIQDAIVLSTAAAIDLGVRDMVGRARPYTYDCIAQGRANCTDDSEAARSFPGGHMAVSTAAAALICTQHLYTHLYGGVGDALACGVGLALDVTVGITRIVGDFHWTSDIIAGSLLGGLVGWGVPTLMWYGFGHGPPFGPHTTTARPAAPRAMIAPMPQIYPGGGGVGALAMF